MLKPLVQPKLAKRYVDRGLWSNETFFEILERQAAAFPEREALCDANGRITYGELKARIERCAECLRHSGIGRGDVVTVQLPNRIDFPVVFFALELIGAVANKVNPDFRVRELEYILNFSGSRAYVYPTEFRGFDYGEMARTLKQKCSRLKQVLSDEEVRTGIAASVAIGKEHRVRMDPDEIFRMAFTSGTTGDPKCVLHSFNTTLYAARLLNDDMRVTADDVLLIYLPMGLNWGYLTLLQTLMAGARAVLLERFSAAAALELIEKEKVSYIATAPAAIVAILNDPSLKQRDLSSLRVVITGGASAAVETIRAYQANVHGHLIELYGMLETGFHTYTRFEDDPQAVNGTIGRVVGEMELRLIDERGGDVPHGETGEIAARGPTVHLGYHNNPEANAQSFTEDGWFRTGDLGRYADRKGNVQITGRSKEIINRGGKKFFPREVEEILYTHPKIMHAAMVGLPDARLGERNCLCVVPKQGAELKLAEVVEFLRGEVADYKLPEHLEHFSELPLTGTGKIRRHILRDWVLERQSKRV
ncbi:MAG TPA: AMP-binding protein [Burkholderiales bacterium]|nr:AMP-binding protein [Burkholderiales bacterium]